MHSAAAQYCFTSCKMSLMGISPHEADQRNKSLASSKVCITSNAAHIISFPTQQTLISLLTS